MKIKNRFFLIFLKRVLVYFLLFSLLKDRSLKIKKYYLKYKNIGYYLIFFYFFFIYIYNIIKLIYKQNKKKKQMKRNYENDMVKNKKKITK